jgi:hypothetical protein
MDLQFADSISFVGTGVSQHSRGTLVACKLAFQDDLGDKYGISKHDVW